jgi:16S rRNA (uracil1498-N3)-methyltransferase
LRTGETVTLADGAGRWRCAEVVDVAGATLTVRATGGVAREPVLTPKLTVAFAPARAGEPEEVVRALTELGVDAIRPLVTARGVVRWREGRSENALRRLRRAAREAAAQCRRARLPEIGDPVELSELAGTPGLLLGDASGEPPSAARMPAGDWTVVTGPEGGFAREEREALAGATAIAVGPHVLRAVTAPVVLAGVVAAYRNPTERPENARD